MLRWIIL